MTPEEALNEIVGACGQLMATGSGVEIPADRLALVLQDFDDRLKILEREAGLR